MSKDIFKDWFPTCDNCGKKILSADDCESGYQNKEHGNNTFCKKCAGLQNLCDNFGHVWQTFDGGAYCLRCGYEELDPIPDKSDCDDQRSEK